MGRKIWSEHKSLERKKSERPEVGVSRKKGGYGALNRRHAERNSTQAERFIEARLDRGRRSGRH